MAFTYFFRDMNTFRLVEEHVVPSFRTTRQVKIWDAGCASGEEPYTLAIMLREWMGHYLFRNVRILATDLNGDFARVVSDGIYTPEKLQRAPEGIVDRHFGPAPDGEALQVCEEIRSSIQFRQHDLTTLAPPAHSVSLIVCKNVLLHLSPEQRVEVLRMFHETLSDGGFLAVEQTQKMPPGAERWFTPVAADGPLFARAA